MLRSINSHAVRVLKSLVNGLNNIGDAKKIDNSNGAYMPVCVEIINKVPAGKIVSVAHYGEQNGDAMRDPDVCFLEGHRNNKTAYFPISFRNDYLGINREAVVFNDLGEISGWRPHEQRDNALFCNTWMQNIEQQQGIKLAA